MKYRKPKLGLVVSATQADFSNATFTQYLSTKGVPLKTALDIPGVAGIDLLIPENDNALTDEFAAQLKQKLGDKIVLFSGVITHPDDRYGNWDEVRAQTGFLASPLARSSFYTHRISWLGRNFPGVALGGHIGHFRGYLDLAGYHIEMVKTLLGEAQRYGIPRFEFEMGDMSLPDMICLTDKVNQQLQAGGRSVRLKVNADTGNPIYYGTLKPEEIPQTIEKLGTLAPDGRVTKLHVKSAQKHWSAFVPLGQGIEPLNECIGIALLAGMPIVLEQDVHVDDTTDSGGLLASFQELQRRCEAICNSAE